MATFDADEITDIAVMFETNSDAMDAHLDFYGPTITDTDKTAILAQVTRFQNGTMKGSVWFKGTESNEGFYMSAAVNADNRDPRAIVAGLISWQWSASGRLVRA